jgi:Xaa-Pro aminopeptidase
VTGRTNVDKPYFQADFPVEEFATRRMRVAEEIGSGAVAVLRGGISTGAFDIFRQTNEFYYLCGVEAAHACLRIEGGSGATTLYLPHGDEHAAASEGKELNSDEAEIAAAITGVDAVRPLEALAGDLRGARTILTPLSPGEARMQCRDTLKHARRQRQADPWEEPTSTEERFRDRLAAIRPDAEFRDLSPILDRLRLVKSAAEIAMMRRAGALTALAVREAMRSTRPGVTEYQLGAIADYLYLVNGAKGGGYRPIISSGASIWNAHYYRNNQPLRDGDLVLMDYAPDVGCYTSDIGRMWPINGEYNDWQRELYGFIVEYHKALLDTIRPGLTADQIHAAAAERMRPRVESTRWSKPAYALAARKALEFKGHLSHPVGMAVHDVGDYRAAPLAPGVVFALDPQMWVPEERLYIRVEDTVAVTDSGIENLTSLAPLEMDDVERTIAETGMLQRYPPLE